MDSRQFDDLARSLGAGSSRRRLLKGLGAGIAAAVAAGGRGMSPASVSAKGRPPCCPRGEGYTAVCPTTAGGHACTDTTSDLNNCGGCGIGCSTGQTCQGGVCSGGPGCSTDADCDDTNVCTTDTCVVGVGCNYVPVQAGTSCAASTCNGTTRTVWACDGAGACASTAIDCGAYVCWDGNACYTSCGTNEQCAPGYTCVHGICRPPGWCESVSDCPAPPDPCQVARCDNNQCGEVNAPTGTSCAAATCNGTTRTVWVCDGAGVCGSTETNCGAYVCWDGNTCYTSCVGNAACSPGYSCVNGLCMVTTCTTAEDCDDLNPCTLDTCLAGLGCAHTPLDNGIPCGTQGGTCQGGECVAPSCGNGICDAGENCTNCPADCGACAGCIAGITEACYTGPVATRNVGMCRDGTRVCQSDGTWGPCEGEVLPAPEQCDNLDNDCDGLVDENFDLQSDVNNCGFCRNICPYGESCLAGVCGRACSTAADCNDGNVCTVDTCRPDGFCVNAIVQNGTSCAPCGTCQGGICTPVSGGITCRSATDLCDLPATCNGSSLSCPPNGFRNSSYVCRASVDPCDIPEMCTGSSASCPSDAKWYACRPCTFPSGGSGYCWNGQCMSDVPTCP